ncbi:MAG: hypothetical protein ASARMPRED_003986 [Alectoria sarmentosa]|nr:MAG: hypothetical protein ASARMPRED_003986 [Alectoria sarmentosa]
MVSTTNLATAGARIKPTASSVIMTSAIVEQSDDLINVQSNRYSHTNGTKIHGSRLMLLSHPEISDQKYQAHQRAFQDAKYNHGHRMLTDERSQKAAVRNDEYHHRGRMLQLELNHHAVIQRREYTQHQEFLIQEDHERELSYPPACAFRAGRPARGIPDSGQDRQPEQSGENDARWTESGCPG